MKMLKDKKNLIRRLENTFGSTLLTFHLFSMHTVEHLGVFNVQSGINLVPAITVSSLQQVANT